MATKKTATQARNSKAETTQAGKTAQAKLAKAGKTTKKTATRTTSEAKAPKSKTTRTKSAKAKKTQRPAATPMKVYTDMLAHLADDNRFRHIPEAYQPQSRKEERIDLASNDYLGLGAEADLYREEFLQRFPDAVFSSSASRLLSRHNKYHNLLEALLEELYGKPALLFNSGYHANVGIIQALAVPGTMFVADKLVHASAIDGMRLSGAEFKRFPHNAVSKLRRILNENYEEYDRFVVIVESIYSMDGDLTPLRELVKVRKEYPKVMLYVDEAHAFGVRGKRGLGLAEEYKLIDQIDIIIGTLGKAAASAGAFAICSREMKDYLINCARSFIFSTAISPAQAAWSILMIEKIITMNDRRERLKELSREFVKQMEKRNNMETPSDSQIVPMIIGDAGEAVNLSNHLRANGFDALAIRKPTVAAGTERIRFSLNALLTKKDITRLVGAIGKYR